MFKMRIVLIFFSASLLITFADAQRKLNITKPVVNLEKRPRPPAWNRPPEERRKLSIFPKNNMKFVVTPKTVVKNDDTGNQGLPTKRPLVRRFTMQDRNDKGTWSFPPREPLMKTNRFTVTLAPPKSNRKGIGEMESEESKKVNTVISHPKIEQPIIQNHNLNKGNLIDITQIKKMEPQPSNNIENDENKSIGQEISEITKENDSENFDIIQMNDNSRSDKVSKDNAIDIRSLDDEDIILNANETKNERKKENGSIIFKQAPTLDTKLSKNLLESRAVDLNELKYAIEQNENNALTMDSEESNTAQILSFNDLEILLEKIVNETESSAAEYNENSLSNSTKNETQGTLQDIPKFDVTKPNQFYDVISLSSGEDKNTNFEQDFLHGTRIIENNEKPSVSETNILNGEEDFTENASDSLVVGNLESLINFMVKETAGVDNHHQRDIVAHDAKETKTNTKYTSTEKPLTNTATNDEISSSVVKNTVYEIQTEFPEELISNDTDSFNSTEILLEMYESNMSLSSEELEADVEDEIPNENVKLSGLEILNEPFINSVSVDEISNESISNSSNNYTKERSKESFIDTLTGEGMSYESSSILAGEELSNESSSLIEEISNETSNNYTGEENSNESSSNMAGEEISNESYPDNSNNLTEEISNEYTMETSDNFTGEVISNDSSSNVAGEVISNESEESYNLTEEISSESTVEASHSFIDEEISEGSLIDDSEILIDVRISGKSAESSQEPEIAEGSLINRFKRSNNIIEEENLPTTVSGFKYTGNEITQNHDLSYKNINA